VAVLDEILGATFIIALCCGVGLLGLSSAMHALMRRRARALQGQPVPPFPGALGRSLTSQERALVYFYCPSCEGSQLLTPKMQEMSLQQPSVFLVDIERDSEAARALGIGATPSVVEVAQGRIVDVHLGEPPASVLARYSRPRV